MKLDCDVLLERNGISWQRAQKGYVSIGRGTVKGPTSSKSYFLTVVTVNTKKELHFSLNSSTPVEIITKFAAAGRLSIMMSAERSNLFISKANPTSVQKFAANLAKVLKGDQLTLKEINSGHASIQGPRSMTVSNKSQYPSEGFPKTLDKLTLASLNLQKIDGRWFSLSLLTHLDLSNNILAKAPNLSLFSKINRLTNLESLNLSGNRLSFLPEEVWSAMPVGLKNLDLSNNLFPQMPVGIYNLINLQTLRINDNLLDELPDELFRLVSLKNLDISRCRLSFLPYAMYTKRMQLLNLFISGNPFLDSAQLPVTIEPSEIPPLEEIALSKILNNQIDISIIPECLKTQLRFLNTVCSFCLSFTPVSFLRVIYRIERSMTLATTTDGNRPVPLKLSLCLSCRKYF